MDQKFSEFSECDKSLKHELGEQSQNTEPFQLSATLKQGAPPKVTTTNQAPRPTDQ